TLPTVAIREQLLLVVIQLLARFGGELEIRPFHDGIDRTGFLAQAAINALHHVDVVARGAAAAVGPRLRFDGDGKRGTNRLAQFGRDAAVLYGRIGSQGLPAVTA